MPLTLNEKKALLKNLIDLAEIDGSKNEEELTFISALARGAGISDVELQVLINSEIEFVVPKNEFDRIEHMHKLMLLMASDNTFSEIEKQFIGNIGLRMGIRPQATITLIEMMEASPDNLLSPTEIISVYNIYYN